MIDVLELMRPSTTKINIFGKHVEVESLRFLEWFKFDSLSAKILWKLTGFHLADGLGLICEALEAAGLPTSKLDAGDALAVFVVLGKLNEIRYIDPDLKSSEQEGARGDASRYVFVEVITTLATRFSMEEILDMTPEFALLSWQKIREEIAADRSAMFYSTEMGYDKKPVGKKGRYKLYPRKSPYTPAWVDRRVKRMRLEEVGEMEEYTPKFVMQPGEVIDARTGKKLKDLRKGEDQNGT